MRNPLVGAAASMAVVSLVTLAGCGPTQDAVAETPAPVFGAPSDPVTVQFVRDPPSRRRCLDAGRGWSDHVDH